MKKMLVILFAMISFVAFSQENVVKEWHFVQPDGGVKIGHQVIPTIDAVTKYGTIYDPKYGTTVNVRFDKTLNDFVIDGPSGPSVLSHNGYAVECHCNCCGNRYCPMPGWNNCYKCPRCNNGNTNPYFQIPCSCGVCWLVIVEE